MKKSFRATIEGAGGGGAFVTIPFDVEKTFGSKRPKIKATFDGEPYRGTLVRMGSESHMLLILKEIRGKISKQVGDEVTVTIEPDTEPRVVDVPEGLQKAFRTAPKAKKAFGELSYTGRREFVRWINDAKREETRDRRIEKCLTLLEAGKKEP